jgi:ATP-dependent protease ClpP protease subunit
MAKKAEIKLYGDINEWGENSAGNFTSRLDALKHSNSEVVMRLHCYGGSVIEGNVIANSVEKDGKVSIQIDGIAASMGAFLLPYAKHVSMAENAYIMIHSPKLYAGSLSADELEKEMKVLRNMENILVAKLKEKTRQTEDVIKSWFVGDNWFSAQEAKDSGLIDEIVSPVANVDAVAKLDLKGYTAQSVYNRFTAYLKDDLNNKQLNFYKMNKQDFIARFGLTGVTAESSEADIYAALDSQIQAEKTAKKAAEDALKSERDKQIIAVVDTAVAAKKITSAQKEKFVAIGNAAGAEALQMALDAIKTVPGITGLLGGGSSGQSLATRADWNWDKWEKEDTKGLEALAQSDYDSFNALYKAKFGVNAPK